MVYAYMRLCIVIMLMAIRSALKERRPESITAVHVGFLIKEVS